MTDTDWMRLVQADAARLDDAVNRLHELQFAAVAGEPMTVLGKPVRFEIVWLEGLPGSETEDSVREFARQQLVRMRANR